MKLRNAPISILIAATLIAIGAIFNFVIGLVLSLAPQLLQGIEVPTTPNGAPTQLLVIAGVACIALVLFLSGSSENFSINLSSLWS